MTLIRDARGNEWNGAIDVITNQTATDARAVGATLNTLNAEVVMDLNGHAVALFHLQTAAANVFVVFEATVDGTNYFGLPGFNVLTETMIAALQITTTQSSVWAVGVSGFRRVRCRMSSYTSGTLTVNCRATQSDYAIYSRPVPATLHVTATAAANTIATATLPAAGAGLFHYITHIHLCRNATAALAGGATLIHTSTNLPGNPAWSVGNNMIAGGTQIDLEYCPVAPLKSSVANTATTIVMPAAGAAVLNRINVSYYIGA
jgi:hypothetical protein